MEFLVKKSEKILFAIKIIATIGIIVGIICVIPFVEDAGVATTITPIIVYVVMIFAYLWFYKVFLVAHMKGNGVCVSETQFPVVFQEYVAMAEKLELKKIPLLFILQSGGVLNAFAIRLSGKNYIAIYSDIFSEYKTDFEAVKFVLAHELGHIKRRHNQKRFWTMLSSVVPFLTAAYSRAYEYTCDNIGSSFIPDPSGKIHGLLLLAGGKDIYKEINVNNYLETARNNRTFCVKFINLFLSHPYLPKRIANLQVTKLIE